MSREVSRIAIGGFVVGALGIAILVILMFGSGKFFQQRSMHVLFFEGSVQGLNVGSPVKFRGVDIGEVKKIQLTIHPADLEFYVPVYVEIFRNRISILGGWEMEEFADDETVDTLVQEMGLRAQLQMQSLLTGQLFINYEFHPDTPIRKVGLDEKVYEVPTIPTTLQMLTETMEQIIADIREADIQEIAADIAQTAKGANALVNSADLQESVTNLNTALKDMQRFIEEAEALVDKADARLDIVAGSFESTMNDTRKVVNDVGRRVEPVAADIESALAAVRASFVKAENVMTEARQMISENSRLRGQILVTLESVADASRSLEELTDYLQRHPEAIVTGKK